MVPNLPFFSRAMWRISSTSQLPKGAVTARFLIFLAVLACCAVAWGDIEVKPQLEDHEPCVATITITGVPAGAKLRGSFAVSDGSYLPAGENTYHIWAPPGKHLLKATGVWVLSKDVTVGDQTFPVLLDFGQYVYEKTITVGEGPSPNPFPQPDPLPTPGIRWAIIWEESSQRTPAQAALLQQVRKSSEQGKLFILDPSQLPPKWLAWQKVLPNNQALPALMVIAGDKLVRVVPLPSSAGEVVKEVAR
jgi:hypothetical protein